jgi:hypothetical protein
MSAGKTSSRASGRFLLRLDPGLHAALRSSAGAAGLSLNDYCVRRLADAGRCVSLPGAADTIARAAAVAAGALAGVVLFGSWIRSDLSDSSDVDVLIVVDRSVRLTRALYQRWDERPVTWEGRAVEPHFVWLPDRSTPATGLWAEVAIDGVVLFERGLQVSAALARVRREILSGRLVRGFVHGQPYWTEVA